MDTNAPQQPPPLVIYALIFPGGRCYVGQTQDFARRVRQHRAPSGGWGEPIVDALILDQCYPVPGFAMYLEYAWRYVAHQAGWRIYAQPGALVDRLTLDAATWPEVKRLAMQEGLAWPVSISP